MRRGLRDTQRAAAAEIYWQAFGQKLAWVMGPRAKALAFLGLALRDDHCLSVENAEGELLGVAGFKTRDGGFAAGTPEAMRQIYGRFGGLWRAWLLRLLANDVDNQRFLIDGIAVAEAARGQGVGHLLIEGLCDLARAKRYQEIRLEVVDYNLRARALYESLGFEIIRSDRIGALRLIFGFRAAHVMVKRLD